MDLSWECDICGYIYEEMSEGTRFEDLPEDWECPICGAPKSQFSQVDQQPQENAEITLSPETDESEYLQEWSRTSDETETRMAAIHKIAISGQSLIEPMGTKGGRVSWDDILIKGAQLSRIPLNPEDQVNTSTILGPSAKQPLVIETPIIVSHMSFGALSREAKIALAKGSAAEKTAMCSGEGGVLPDSLENSYRYIFEYVPHQYSVTEELLRSVDAIEIKIGQSAKPGMGGHLPGLKVTEEIADVRGFPAGKDIHSPAHFNDIRNLAELKQKVEWLRVISEGRPIGIKLAAGQIEADLAIALGAKPDFITIDGRPGATGAAPKFIKDSTSIPTIFALFRACKFLKEQKADDVSLVITGGLRISSDFAKALALGADAIALASAALIACGCQQYRICNTGNCPVGIATQDPILRKRLDIEESARRLSNFLRVSTEELCSFARLTGNSDIHKLAVSDLCTLNSEISNHTDISHV